MELHIKDMTATLYNLKASNQKISVKLLSKKKVLEDLRNIDQKMV